MGSPPLSLKRALLLSAFFALGVLAQDDNNNNNDDDKSTSVDPATTEAESQTSTTSAPRETSTSEAEESSSESSESKSSSSASFPKLSTTRSSQGRPTDFPTLTRTTAASIDTSIPQYPAPTIPPTRNAPFMNHSTLPDGTVFIAVGAILGAFGLAVLAWRGIVACLLHRSVERAAMAQHAANNGHTGRRGGGDKNAASFPAPPAQFYKYIERESSGSLAAAGLASGSGARRTNRGPTPSSTPSQTNLFFSPTAVGSSGLGGSGSNRDSARFLPSGFYASASPAGGGSHGQGNSISMSTLRPGSRGRTQLGPSPPESPDVGPRGGSRNFSTSSLNLNRPPSPGARAPSAYLDDLLDENPGMFPPAGGSPGHHQRHPSHGRRY